MVKRATTAAFAFIAAIFAAAGSASAQALEDWQIWHQSPASQIAADIENLLVITAGDRERDEAVGGAEAWVMPSTSRPRAAMSVATTSWILRARSWATISSR